MNKTEFRNAYQAVRIACRIDDFIYARTGKLSSLSWIYMPMNPAIRARHMMLGDCLSVPASTSELARKSRSLAFRRVRLPA